MAEEETEAAASEENAEGAGDDASSDAEVVEGKFGKAEITIPDTVQKAPDDSQKHYHSIANKGETLKVTSEKVLGSSNKEELKELSQGSNVGSVQIKSLEILSRSETADFASITYKAEIEYDLGDTTIISKISGISVYLKENNDYINIYDANRF